MTVSRDIATAIPLARQTLAARLLACALLATLTGCAAGTSTTSVAPTAAAEPAAAAAAPAPGAAAPAAPPAPPAAARAAKPPPPPPPPAPPDKLTATEINEKCWMDPAINKVPDLDKRLKLVDKCVDEKTKAQGGL